MKITDLQKIMDEGKMSPYGYSINKGEKDDAYHIMKEDGKWHIYYMERGHKNSYGYFEKEEEAAKIFLTLIKEFL